MMSFVYTAVRRSAKDRIAVFGFTSKEKLCQIVRKEMYAYLEQHVIPKTLPFEISKDINSRLLYIKDFVDVTTGKLNGTPPAKALVRVYSSLFVSPEEQQQRDGWSLFKGIMDADDPCIATTLHELETNDDADEEKDSHPLPVVDMDELKATIQAFDNADEDDEGEDDASGPHFEPAKVSDDDEEDDNKSVMMMEKEPRPRAAKTPSPTPDIVPVEPAIDPPAIDLDIDESQIEEEPGSTQKDSNKKRKLEVDA
jgi:hypothetical protein